MHDILHPMRRERRDDEGFTLIELLVVVVIIGVLVAIAVPVYLNYRQGAADKSAQSDVRGAISAVEQAYTESGNSYPTTEDGENTGAANTETITLAPSTQKITLSDKTKLGYNKRAGGLSYFICATNSGGSGKWYIYDSLIGGSVKDSAAATPSVTAC